ncbi:NAD(P)-dependent oxidoreductase [Stenotrophomonas rhizophila]|uniref:Phosphoglycerate dehydrogenase-like enzyme n=1 Tax=Stenotrophomonas rhizophila TaxID=216778 RepID=A0AAW5PML8_9GAMM|nr:NAD(P)-dependent oxidoreductase [Stenotrophomonas rhizophila]MCS4281394.1 phosphoglycerate dehydrogenase-like enzyme [Stenotrophomonas rhizophila]
MSAIKCVSNACPTRREVSCLSVERACVIVDDYQNVAVAYADWNALGEAVQVRTLTTPDTGDALVAALGDADILVVMRERTPITAALLARLPRLRLLITSGMRNAAVDVAAAKGDHRLRHRQPSRACRGDDLGADPRPDASIGAGGQRATQRRAMAADGRPWPVWCAVGDVVSLHLVLGERSRGIVDADTLACLPIHACLINTARAGLVDQQALIDAVTERRIAGVGLDVFDIEPLPAGHPLCT